MTVFEKTLWMPFGHQDLFRLVNHIEAYPEFLPWCARSEIHERSDDRIKASLVLKAMGLEKEIVTCNTLKPFHRIDMVMEEPDPGLISIQSFNGYWLFEPKEQEGKTGTQVSLYLGFQISSGLFGFALNRALLHVAETLVESFRKRAETLYVSQNVSQNVGH